MAFLDGLFIALAAFVGGILNAVAGGGTFITFPALIAIGIPAVSANATSTLAALPGYISSSWGFRTELLEHPRQSLIFMLWVAVFGGVLGAALLILTSEVLFRQLVPWLLLFATIIFAFGETITSRFKRSVDSPPSPNRIGLVASSIYGGYFNGGLGIILLALFAASGYRDIHQMNGLKTLLSAVLAVSSVTAFILAGLITWPEAMVMMIASVIGGYVGVIMSKKVAQRAVKATVVVIASIITVLFFITSDF